MHFQISQNLLTYGAVYGIIYTERRKTIDRKAEYKERSIPDEVQRSSHTARVFTKCP